MPRDSNGTYTLPLDSVVSGTVISSTWANTSLNDIASAISDSLSRTGNGGMLVPFTLTNGSVNAPSLAFTAEPTLGLYRESAGVLGVAGALVASALGLGTSTLAHDKTIWQHQVEGDSKAFARYETTGTGGDNNSGVQLWNEGSSVGGIQYNEATAESVLISPTGTQQIVIKNGSTEIKTRVDVTGGANSTNEFTSTSGSNGLILKSGDTSGTSYLFFNDANGENARITGTNDTLYLQVGVTAETAATLTSDIAILPSDLNVGGHVGIGVIPSPSFAISAVDALARIKLEGTGTGGANQATVLFYNEGLFKGQIGYREASDDFEIWSQNGSLPTMTMDVGNNVFIPNGNLNIGAFSVTGLTNGIQLGSGQSISSRTILTNAAHATFYNPNGPVGTITTNGNATAFNTNSDPRLKSDFVPITGALDKIEEARDQGMIGEFHFLSDTVQKVWGYNAHKLIDAQEGFGGTEGHGSRAEPLGGDIRPAGVDASKRVPILEAAIGELLDRIAVLESV